MVSGFFLGGLTQGFQNEQRIQQQQDYEQGLLKLAQKREQNQQQNKQRAEFMQLRSDAVAHLQETMSQLRIAHPDWTEQQLASNPAVVSLRDMLGGFDKNLGLPNTIDSIVAGFAANPQTEAKVGIAKTQAETSRAQASTKLINQSVENNASNANPANPDLDTETQLGGTDAETKGQNFLHSLPGSRGLNAKGLYDGTTPITSFSTRTGKNNTKSQRQQAVEDAETYGALIGQPFDINRAANLKISETAQNKADSSTLTQLTQNKEALSAFEDTAKSNTKLLLDLAKKIPDTGSPLINTPVRTIAQLAFGNKDVGAFNFQLESVKSELARIIRNPRLVGQLTDDARRKVDGALGEGATVGMILEAYKTAVKDFQNRTAGLDKSIGEVKDRLAGKSTNKTYKFNPDTGELE